jgi:hypothetical protein
MRYTEKSSAYGLVRKKRWRAARINEAQTAKAGPLLPLEREYKRVHRNGATFRRISKYARLMRPSHVRCVCRGNDKPTNEQDYIADSG